MIRAYRMLRKGFANFGLVYCVHADSHMNVSVHIFQCMCALNSSAPVAQWVSACYLYSSMQQSNAEVEPHLVQHLSFPLLH